MWHWLGYKLNTPPSACLEFKDNKYAGDRVWVHNNLSRLEVQAENDESNQDRGKVCGNQLYKRRVGTLRQQQHREVSTTKSRRLDGRKASGLVTGSHQQQSECDWCQVNSALVVWDHGLHTVAWLQWSWQTGVISVSVAFVQRRSKAPHSITSILAVSLKPQKCRLWPSL